MATILGLLLIVTFIANYITTTLPSQMGQNDLQHDVIVQNQVSQLSALLEATAETGEVGLQVTQPVTLGSAGAYPFATQDSSTIFPLTNGSGLSVNFTLVGPIWTPTGGTPNAGSATECTLSPATAPTRISCPSSSNVFWNFSAGSHTNYHFTQTGSGAVQVNFTTNYSLVAVNTSSANSVVVIGNHDTIYVNATLATASVSVLLVGSNNTVVFTPTVAGPATAISIVGDYDSVTAPTLGGSVFMKAYGGHDSFTDSTGTAATVYYIGFNLEHPTSGSCPYGNAANSDTVAGAIGGTVNYNNTNSVNTNHVTGKWAYTYLNPPGSACPYVVAASIAQTPTATGFVVALRNTYSPYAEVAYDEGAVVTASSGGIPVFLVPPTIGLANGVLQIFLPQFSNTVGSEAGVGTAALSLQLLEAPQVTIPGQSYAFANNTQVNVKLVSPYAAAWASYFLSVPLLSSHLKSCAYPTYPHPVTVTCSALAKEFYQQGGPLGTVILSVPATGLELQYLVGLYSVNLE